MYQGLVPGREFDSIKFGTRLGHRVLRQEETPLGGFTLVSWIRSGPSGVDKAFLFDGVTSFQKSGHGVHTPSVYLHIYHTFHHIEANDLIKLLAQIISRHPVEPEKFSQKICWQLFRLGGAF